MHEDPINQYPLPTQEQHNLVEKFLGRRPKGQYRIAKADTQNSPVVLQVPPLIDGVPFPTVFWLCCPKIKKKIDHLEAAGLVKDWEKLIQKVPELFKKVQLDHERYRDYRWQLLSQEDIENCDNPNKIKDLKEKGIGGVQKWTQIRCLHMHYAHHLVQGNTLGKMLDEQYF
jgi:hypothetical protein